MMFEGKMEGIKPKIPIYFSRCHKNFLIFPQTLSKYVINLVNTPESFTREKNA